MCRENVTIAQCAPHDPLVLSFTCGKLHMVAQGRVVCDKAEGKCVCYFGTCGLVTREITTGGIDLSSISKIRCATCVVREDNVGDRRSGREILESPLLERLAVDKAGKENHARLLNSFWRGKAACPYHSEDIPDSFVSHALSDVSVDSPAQIEVAVQPVAKAAVNEPFSVDAHATDAPTFDAFPEEHSDVKTTELNPTSVESVQVDIAETTGAEPIATEPVTTVDEWTSNPAPTIEHDKDASAQPTFDSGIKNGLEREIGIETSRWAPLKPSDPMPKEEGQEKVQDNDPSDAPDTKPRRIPTVNFAFDPNNADKLRDVTQKLASLKSQFLLGKAF